MWLHDGSQTDASTEHLRAIKPLAVGCQPIAWVADLSPFASCLSFILQILQVCAIVTLTRFGNFRRCIRKNWGSANQGYAHARQIRMGAR